MSMHTPEEWAHTAGANLTQARSAQHSAHRQIETSCRSHDCTVADNLSMYDSLHNSMAQKVRNSYRLLEKLQKRAESVESSLQKTKSSQQAVEKALRDKDVPLQLCCWRLEQREKRPLREQVRDNVEIALEEEKATLNETQRRLADAVRRTKAMVTELVHALEEVRGDIEHKMQALSIDEMCLRSAERSMHAVVERTPPPPSARSGRSPNKLKMSRHQVALQESSKNEVQRQQECERMNRSCIAREEAAKALREDNAKLMQRCETAASEAANKTERRMQERIHDNQQMRRRLEAEMRETQDKIDHTKHTMSETKHQIKALDEPIDLTSSCAAWRKQRVAREHISDPVSTALQEHRMTVLQAQQELVHHHQQEKGNLKELQERRERLKEDLRDKTASLHIDLNCLTHEAVSFNGKASTSLSQHKLTKAMKLDRSFVPGAVRSAR
mmetsp:Transcript_33906/g.97579  ORF Transcript_33906/g.97579 Transcript_33906/m.97579 type:complete len:443 (+) Transcript_33906:103-1431(+)